MKRTLGDTGYFATAELGENKLHVDFNVYLVDDDHDEYEFNICVKWDGCSNWQTNDDCMAHGCERDHLINAGQALALCWDWAKEIMGDRFIG